MSLGRVHIWLDENPFAFLVPNHEQVFMARHEGKARHEGNEPMAYGALDTCGLGGGAFVLQGGCVGERHLSTKQLPHVLEGVWSKGRGLARDALVVTVAGGFGVQSWM